VLRTEGKIYQIKFSYYERKLRVSKPVHISDDINFILHEWTAKAMFNELTADMINESIAAADRRNAEQQEENMIEEDAEMILESLNFDKQSLNDDDLELINELLENY